MKFYCFQVTKAQKNIVKCRCFKPLSLVETTAEGFSGFLTEVVAALDPGYLADKTEQPRASLPKPSLLQLSFPVKLL